MSFRAVAENSEAVEVLNPDGHGAAVILCEHASNFIPERYHGLNLSEEARHSHAAWDPGARGLSLALSKHLDAPVIASKISRLVYDCNRPPDSDSAILQRSEFFDIPGNRNLAPEDRKDRINTVYKPFCQTVEEILSLRQSTAQPTALITVHSFTQVYFGKRRSVEIGILHDQDSRMADIMLAEASRLSHRRIARNQPYGPEDGVTHSLKIHGMANRLPNVMLEVRNDLLDTPDAETILAHELMSLLTPALASVLHEAKGTARA